MEKIILHTVLKIALIVAPVIAMAQNSTKNSNENLIPFQNETGQWGYLDAQTEKVQIKPQYGYVNLFKDGLARVFKTNPQAKNHTESQLSGWIDTTGHTVFKPRFKRVYDIGYHRSIRKKDTIARLKEVKTQDDQVGVIDLEDREWVMKPGHHKDFYFYNKHHFLADKTTFYAHGTSYSAPQGKQIDRVDIANQLFFIKKDKEHPMKGIATWDGKILLKPEYVDITYLDDQDHFLTNRPENRNFFQRLKEAFMNKDKSLVKELKGEGVIVGLHDKNGKTLKEFSADYEALVENDSLGSYKIGDKTHYFSLKNGREIPREKVTNRAGYAVFKQGQEYGLKNTSGDVIIEPHYKKLGVVRPDFIIAAKVKNGSYGTSYGVIDTNENTVIPFDYEDLGYRSQHCFLSARKDGEYGIINEDGHTVVDFKYRNTFFFEDGLAKVYADGKKGIIDTTGKEVIPLEYNILFNTKQTEDTDTVYFQAEKDGAYGLLSRTGDIIVPFDYGFVSIIEGETEATGWVRVDDKNRQYSGLYNFKTEVEIPMKYDITRLYDDFIIVATRDGNTYHYQLLNKKGKPLTEDDYTKMDYKNGYLAVRKDDKYGVISTQGDVLIPLQYDYLWEVTANLVRVKQEGHYFYVTIDGKEYRQPE